MKPVEVGWGNDRRNRTQRGDLGGERMIELAWRVDENSAVPELDHCHTRVEPGAAQPHSNPPQRIGDEDFERMGHSQHLQRFSARS